MALITVTGEPGCRSEEVARLTATRLGFQLVGEPGLRDLIATEFGSEYVVPPKAYPHMVTSIVARLATESHVVLSAAGAEFLFRTWPAVLRVFISAPEARRTGTLMIDHRLDRECARKLLKHLESQARKENLQRFRRAAAPLHFFDLALSEASLEPEQIAATIEAAAAAKALTEQGLLSTSAEAHIEFQVRLQLAKHGIAAPGKYPVKRVQFANPSEEIFANLLDFYRISWKYEPKSFPIQWGPDGKVLEAITPDFYLPDFDMYVELTTMKQSLVTKKNRKVKLLRAIYPHVNIQVFYQKDLQDLIFKHGLASGART
jgi:cytidylate kinase